MNQCDGCKRGLPLKDGIHVDGNQLYMVCTASNYQDTKSLADLMQEAEDTSFDVAYATISPDGHYLDARDLPEHSDMVWAHKTLP